MLGYTLQAIDVFVVLLVYGAGFKIAVAFFIENDHDASATAVVAAATFWPLTVPAFLAVRWWNTR